MECRICGREKPSKYFPKRIIAGSGQVIKICTDCDPVDIDSLAHAVAKKIDVDISTDSYAEIKVR